LPGALPVVRNGGGPSPAPTCTGPLPAGGSNTPPRGQTCSRTATRGFSTNHRREKYPAVGSSTGVAATFAWAAFHAKAPGVPGKHSDAASGGSLGRWKECSFGGCVNLCVSRSDFPSWSRRTFFVFLYRICRDLNADFSFQTVCGAPAAQSRFESC
jgi:hypothetical protein